ncbi:MAG: alpha-L-fucosidase [Pirellulales bacterium]|nr:alpha-L-fucosidase [Pirellulales bacterium]
MRIKQNRFWMLVTLIVSCLCATATRAGDRMEWFNKARFGMFIHWGVYSVPAGEWRGKKKYAEWIMKDAKFSSSEYEKFAKQFNPVQFDAQEWADLAKTAGMKYMVITAKHHDGFCMYDTKLTDYNIVKATPYGRDPMKALADACAKDGLKFCIYYSVVDWHHPDFPAKYSQKGYHGDPNSDADMDKYVQYMQGQVRELLTDYGPIGIMWFDGGGSFKGVDRTKLLHARNLLDMIHELQPACLVNNRLEIGGDYGTPEQRIPGKKQETAFEVCMTLNRHWGYNKQDKQWKEAPEVIHKLVDICSKGGNFLLNVGPTPEGLIPADSIRILKKVGQWMDVNGESIYGTTASPLDETPPWGRITAKPDKLYLHVFDWPKDRQVTVSGINRKIKNAHLLADKTATPLEMDQLDDGFRVSLPDKAPDSVDSVVVVEYAGKPAK